MRLILVDDEPAILEDLKRMLSDKQDIEVVGVYEDPLDALAMIHETKPDCAFLDIEMPGMSGIELADRLNTEIDTIEVIFITAYNHYAAQAFEVNAIDYMLKPIRPERLEKTLVKLKGIVGVKPQSDESHRCKIKSFGAFEVTIGNKSLKWGRSKSKEFLAYMLQNEGKWVAKYKLCDEQWSEYGPDQALAYLQTAVYLLRKNLREIGCKEIEIEFADDRYRVRTHDVDWDVRKFELSYQSFIKSGNKEDALKGTQLYTGEYLEGEDWPWSDLDREAYICQYEHMAEAIGIQTLE